MKTAVELLGVAASMTQNVPYLGIISGALTELLKIRGVRRIHLKAKDILLIVVQEVDTLDEDWRLVMTFAQQIKSVIDQVHAQCEKLGPGAGALLQSFLEPFAELERYDENSQTSRTQCRLRLDRCIVKSLETLHACKVGSKRRRDRVRVFVSRSKLSGDVKQCRVGMQAALDLFNVRLSLANTRHLLKAVLLRRNSTFSTHSLYRRALSHRLATCVSSRSSMT